MPALVLGASLLGALGACSSSDSGTAAEGGAGVGGDGGSGGSPASFVETTISGVVLDEDSQPVQGANVSAHGMTATTDANGVFVIPSVEVPTNRCVAVVSKEGYFNASRAGVPVPNDVTLMHLGLMEHGTLSAIQASSGGTVTAGTATVALPANGYASSTGAFSGEVRVAARHLSPSDGSFFSFFSGDLSGVRSDGSSSELISYGVLRVELLDDQGQALQLSEGQTATLTYPIPDEMKASAPESMPLWYFDEGVGSWVEEGTAQRQGDVFVGTVGHFSDWNCDDPAERAYVKGVLQCAGGPVVHGKVVVGQREVHTDATGAFEQAVPADTPFTVRAKSGLAALVPNPEAVYIGPQVSIDGISAGETYDMGNVPIDNDRCPSYVTGMIVTPEGAPAEGTANAFWSGGFNFKYTSNGAFQLLVQSGQSITVSAAQVSGCISEDVQVAPLAPGEKHDVGQLIVCAKSNEGFWDVKDEQMASFGGAFTLLGDGSRVAMGGHRRSTLNIYDTQTNAKVSTLEIAPPSSNFNIGRIQGDAAGTRLLVDAMTAQVFEVASGTRLLELDHVTWPTLMPDGQLVLARDDRSGSIVPACLIRVSDGLVEKEFSWEPEDWMAQALIGIDKQGTRFLAYDDPTNNNVASAILVWDMVNDAMLHQVNIPAGASLAGYSPDASVLAFADDTSLTFIRAEDGSTLGTAAVPRSHVAISHDGALFATQFEDAEGNLAPPGVFDITTGTPQTLLPAEQNLPYDGFMFSPDDALLSAQVKLGWESTVRVWKME